MDIFIAGAVVGTLFLWLLLCLKALAVARKNIENIRTGKTKVSISETCHSTLTYIDLALHPIKWAGRWTTEK